MFQKLCLHSIARSASRMKSSMYVITIIINSDVNNPCFTRMATGEGPNDTLSLFSLHLHQIMFLLSLFKQSVVFRVHLWAGVGSDMRRWQLRYCRSGNGVAIFWKWGGGVVVVVREIIIIIIITLFIH